MYALVDCNNFYASCERVFSRNTTENLLLFCPIMTVASSLKKTKAAGVPMGALNLKSKLIKEKYKNVSLPIIQIVW